MKILDFVALPLVVQRWTIADKTKPNPVTKVAERMAEPERVLEYIGDQLLTEIHEEIDNANIVDIRQRVVMDNDIVARIHLSSLSRAEQEEIEARQQEQKDLASTIYQAPPKVGSRQQRKIKQFS
jgi:hypothetical protein